VFANVPSNFNGDTFLFVSEDGTVSGWRNALGTTAETLVLASDLNVYKGSALAVIGGHAYLYAANFRQGTIDVIKGDAGAANLTGNFLDPNLPLGFAPFDIANIGGKLFVTYAKQDAAKHDDVPGIGNGFVDVFDLQGQLLTRLISRGSLNSPWGLALAPSSFGTFAGDLLVGNFGDGLIHAFDPLTGASIGELLGLNGSPLMIDGLWSLLPGNGGNGGSQQSIFFSAGPSGESHGLFRVIAAVPEPGTLVLLALGLGGIGFSRSKKSVISGIRTRYGGFRRCLEAHTPRHELGNRTYAKRWARVQESVVPDSWVQKRSIGHWLSYRIVNSLKDRDRPSGRNAKRPTRHVILIDLRSHHRPVCPVHLILAPRWFSC
jgi:uncharacterized protein (TIGR03118 family)